MLCLVSLFLSPAIQAKEKIAVGVYEYPPFFALVEQQSRGVIPDLLRLLNQAQDKVEFTLYITTARRRYKDFQDGKFDMLLFESLDWGWRGYPLDASITFFTGGEVWVALASLDRDQRYFTQFEGKRLIGVLGYHYGFAGLDANPDSLRQRFGMQLVDSQDKVIGLLLQKRADMGLVANSFINRYLYLHPELKSTLLISQSFDQQYQHGALLRRGAKIEIHWLNGVFTELQQSQQLQRLWRKHHLLAAHQAK